MASSPPLSRRTAGFAAALLLSALAAAAAAAAGAATPLPAFPGAEGFGALATGGRGGRICHVTTLADAGPGSFREAVGRPHRVVVFDVGGVIHLQRDVRVANDLTIAGQTAPGDGICLYGAGVSLSRCHNVIVRYLRFREGIQGGRGRKSLGLDRAADVIIDHCSIEWGRWDDLGITVGSHDITVQNCLVAEGIHPQSFGALIDSVTHVTLSHNLWMSNESRNPKAKGTIQYINNVVYNWRLTGLCGGHSAADHQLDVIGNYFIKGPSSNDHFAGQFRATDHVYQSGNFIDLNRNGRLDGRTAADRDFHAADETNYGDPTFVTQAMLHPPVAVTVDPAAVAYARIVAGAGCSRRRDAVDQRLIAELRSLGSRGATLAHTDAAGEALAGGLGPLRGGPTPVDSDQDGIPDAWELAHGLNPRDPSDAQAVTPSGYTNIERYVNSLAPG